MADYGDMFYGTLPQDTQDFRQVLAGIGRTLRDRAIAAGQRIGQSGQEAIALQNQAFGDPRRPTRVTDEAALARLTDMIMGGPMGFAPAGITAYHGSPYLFRMFNPAKVGTGEGAQAYGVGAGYTAEARPVAEDYARKITKKSDSNTYAMENVANRLFKGGFDDAYIKNRLQTVFPNISGEQISNAIKTAKSPEAAGYIYKGDIPDEILPKFLDWDKPIKNQPEILKAIRSNITDKDLLKSFDYNVDKGMAGANAYKNWITGGKTDAERSAILENLGVRGIRYLAQGSRGQGKGTSNFIPFRPEDYKIQEINDIPIEEWVRRGLLD